MSAAECTRQSHQNEVHVVQMASSQQFNRVGTNKAVPQAAHSLGSAYACCRWHAADCLDVVQYAVEHASRAGGPRVAARRQAQHDASSGALDCALHNRAWGACTTR